LPVRSAGLSTVHRNATKENTMTATTAIQHGATVVDGNKPTTIRRECPCGWHTSDFTDAPGIYKGPTPCPDDPTVVALTTLQFASGGLLNSRPVDGYTVHLIRRMADGGTPGPTLCGIDRFAKGSAGWSVSGGISGPNIVHTPCPDCAKVARAEFAGVPVHGVVGGREMAGELGVEYKR
jgi:hypothetical protein